jgi:hypothetical protein
MLVARGDQFDIGEPGRGPVHRPRLWGVQLFVLPLVHEVVVCAPIGSLDQTGPWPAARYLDLGTRGVGSTSPSLR